MATSATPEDDDLPSVPDTHDATRAAEDTDQTLIYDKAKGDGAWIQGYTVDPTRFR